MRLIRLLAVLFTATTMAVVAVPAHAGPPWGPETANFNLQVILRPVAGRPGQGFGLVEFRQPNDADKIVYLDTWVRDLAPNTSYLLQRGVDTLVDDNCTGAFSVTLGKGLVPQAITTDDGGTGRELLFRDLATVPTGAQFDIRFRVVEALTEVPVLESACYRFTVSQ